MIRLYIIVISGLICYNSANSQLRLFEEVPESYVVYRATDSIIMDGIHDEEDWRNVPWTNDFVDIEGKDKPAPLLRTRVKMLWDDDFLYIAAELAESDIWATYTERNSIIFHENNFEVFIDPDGDTHNYYEYEVNALGTEWDLFLTKPYRNGGIPMSAWHISGLRKGIRHMGTINDPSDKDTLWSIELAFPWKIISECAPGRRRPVASEQWRINFSRVEWRLETEDGKYVKKTDNETGRPFPEYNWVWSPQGVIDMHRPESWGYIQFSSLIAGEGEEEFVIAPDEEVKYALRELYLRQISYRRSKGKYARKASKLMNHPLVVNGTKFDPVFEVSATRFKLSAPSVDGKSWWHITEDGRIWNQFP